MTYKVEDLINEGARLKKRGYRELAVGLILIAVGVVGLIIRSKR